MTAITQLHGITPEQLTENISKRFAIQFEDVLKKYSTNTSPTYLTRKETAKMLSISLVCLHDWTNKGILKHYKLGNRTYYKLNEIESALTNSNKK